MSKWIEFKHYPPKPNRKTATWMVINKDTRAVIGCIGWDCGWRKYVFNPYHSTMYEEDCLRDIANFVENETKQHRNRRADDKK